MLNAMRSAHPLFLGLILLIPAASHAQAKCPWMNEATASGILGGHVTATASVDDQGAGVCKFSTHQGPAVRELLISVGIMSDIPKQFPAYLAQCPPNSAPLRAVGNMSVMCGVQGKDNQYVEKVVGRVRNQALVVSVSSTVHDDPSMTQDMRREKVNRVAEQVAGILF
jgi:hypothetical protein